LIFGTIAALAQALGIITDKLVLSIFKIKLKQYVPFIFVFLTLVSFILYPYLGFVDSAQLLNFKYIILFLLMIGVSLWWNLYYYRGIQEEQVQEFELILMLNPLLVILLSAIFLPQERNLHIFVASIIAALALIFAHLKRGHLKFSTSHYRLILCVFLMSIEVIISKFLLEIFSPVALYGIRCAILTIFLILIYKPKPSKLTPRFTWIILFNAILAVSQMVYRYYGYKYIGVMITTLILMAVPPLVYFAAIKYFKEKLRARVIISAAIILACIVYALHFT